MQKRPFPPLSLGVMAACLLAAAPMTSRAELVALFPSRDATLISRNPDNSLGGANWFTAGVTQNGDTNHALLQFDIAAAVPAGARLVGAELRIVVTRLPKDGQTDTTFVLHRVLKPWGEGTNTSAASTGFGIPAAPGDVTWNTPFHAGPGGWGAPGAAAAIDYDPVVSGSTFIGGYSSEPYAFATTPQMTADVQGWFTNPATNFGWLLKTGEEIERFSARGFGSRELNDPTTSAQLIIDYAPPPVLSSVIASNRIRLSFPVAPGGTYRVEACSALGATNAWFTLTNFGYQFFHDIRTASDSLAGSRRFYRVRVE